MKHLKQNSCFYLVVTDFKGWCWARAAGCRILDFRVQVWTPPRWGCWFHVCLVSLWHSDDVVVTPIWPLTPSRWAVYVLWGPDCEGSHVLPWEQTVQWLVSEAFVNRFGQQRLLGKYLNDYYQLYYWYFLEPQLLYYWGHWARVLCVTSFYQSGRSSIYNKTNERNEYLNFQANESRKIKRSNMLRNNIYRKSR